MRPGQFLWCKNMSEIIMDLIDKGFWAQCKSLVQKVNALLFHLLIGVSVIHTLEKLVSLLSPFKVILQ